MAKETGCCDYPQRDCEKCWCKEKSECSAYAYAETYYEKDYRKIDKDSVVLTEEQLRAIVEEEYKKALKDKVVLTKGEHQKYLAYKIIEPQIKGCLDRERELEKTVENLKSENARLYKMKLDLENQLTQKGLTEYIGADEIEAEARKETAEKIYKNGKELFGEDFDKTGLGEYIMANFLSQNNLV